jgi:hypothetical protein
MPFSTSCHSRITIAAPAAPAAPAAGIDHRIASLPATQVQAAPATQSACTATPPPAHPLTHSQLAMPQLLLNVRPAELTPRPEAFPAALGITPEAGLRLEQEVPRLLLLPAHTLASARRELLRASSLSCVWREQMGACCASTFVRCVCCCRVCTSGVGRHEHLITSADVQS